MVLPAYSHSTHSKDYINTARGIIDTERSAGHESDESVNRHAIATNKMTQAPGTILRVYIIVGLHANDVMRTTKPTWSRTAIGA